MNIRLDNTPLYNTTPVGATAPGRQNIRPNNTPFQNATPVGATAPGRPNPAEPSPKQGINPNATDEDLKKEGYNSSEIKDLKRTGKVRCESCDSRRYQDKSDDGGVSFQSPTKLTPAQAASAVAAHENEHVTRNAAKAEREGRVAHSTVRIFTSVCAECNISYVSGGETRTVTKKKAEMNDFAEKLAKENEENNVGNNLDIKIG